MKKLLLAVFGVLAALGVGELATRQRDRGGFPHFNGYINDAELGVRLEPDFDTTIAYWDNPTGQIHVNRQGYRGEDWPDGRTGETVVIGDSQVFGLGVNDDETAATVLSELRGSNVLNMGVPTYGPDEYLAMMDEVAPRKPASIVLVINFANDLFELGHPNKTRHVVLDGWALRGDTLPTHLPFPGRQWLFQRSHLVWAIRSLIHREEEEESWDPAPADALPLPEPKVAGPNEMAPDKVNEAISQASSALWQAELEVAALAAALPDANAPEEWETALYALRDGSRVGDIVTQRFTEAEAEMQITASWLKSAARFRRDAPVRLKKWADAHPKDAAEARKALTELDEARAYVVKAGGLVSVDPGRASAFRPMLASAAARALKMGAGLTIVALPLDVQVDSEEFKKYGETPQDLSETLVLLNDLCTDARILGLRCVIPVESLRAAQPGAFLNGDIHMTAKGQRAFAEALDAALSAAPPDPGALVELPAGRSRVPNFSEWTDLPEVRVTGSTKNGCKTQQIREYLRVECRSRVEPVDPARFAEAEAAGRPSIIDFRTPVIPRPVVTGIVVLEGPLDYFARALTNQAPSYFNVAELVIPVLPGRRIVADFYWTDHVERLTIEPGPQQADAPLGAFEAQPMSTAPPREERNQPCKPGQIHYGSTADICLNLCDDDKHCEAGQCTDVQGFPLCI